MPVAALLLAAGESSRFGELPKALAPIGDRSAICRLAEISVGAGLDPVVVVVGAHRERVAHEVRGLPVSVVEAAEWYEGRTASVQAGLNALPPTRDILFWPVDHPFVRSRTVERLASLPDEDLLGVWFIPTFGGKGGHPVVWRSTVRREVLELRPDAPIRALLPELGPQVRRVSVDDPGVVSNIDTLEAYQQAYDLWKSSGED